MAFRILWHEGWPYPVTGHPARHDEDASHWYVQTRDGTWHSVVRRAPGTALDDVWGELECTVRDWLSARADLTERRDVTGREAITERHTMKAARVLRFGPPSSITMDEVPRPEPGPGQLLVRVKAAGVGQWDALTREGEIQLQPLPLILGAELAGTVAAIGAEVSGFQAGDEVYGSTNEQFTGAYAEYAVPSATRMAQKPKSLNFVEAASIPVVAVTAWQMLFDYAHVTRGQTALILGAAGNVGAYAVQFASQAGVHVIAVAGAAHRQHLTKLGAERVIDYKSERFEESLTGVDVVLDAVGGETQQRSLGVLKRGGILISAVSTVSEPLQERYGVRAEYFIVDVTTARLNKISELFDTGKLVADVGTVLALEDASLAHEMLAGAPHPRGKIVLSVG